MYSTTWSRLGDRYQEDYARPFGLPVEACHIGVDAHERLADFARDRCGTRGLFLSDENTYAAGGEQVLRALTDGGKKMDRRKLGSDPIDATLELGEKVRQAVDGVDFIVGVGSGTIADLAKYAGSELGIPVILYATAASMNGYTSGIVALKVRGLKRTIPCAPATAVFANPEHAAMAPQRMAAAGLADFLSKASSTADWRASHILLGVPYDPRARQFVEGVQERALEAAPEIGRGDPEAIGLLLEALILSGFSMLIAGSSSPASGGEHLISHYLDMKAALYGSPHDLHGAQVGVATIYTLELWQRILGLAPDALDADALVRNRPSSEQVNDWIESDWGSVAPEIRQQWEAKKMSDDQLRAHVAKFGESIDALRRDLPEDLLAPEVLRRAIEAAGGPVEPEALDAPVDEFENAKERARYIRNRFTVLDLAQDLGCV